MAYKSPNPFGLAPKIISIESVYDINEVMKIIKKICYHKRKNGINIENMIKNQNILRRLCVLALKICEEKIKFLDDNLKERKNRLKRKVDKKDLIDKDKLEYIEKFNKVNCNNKENIKRLNALKEYLSTILEELDIYLKKNKK